MVVLRRDDDTEDGEEDADDEDDSAIGIAFPILFNVIEEGSMAPIDVEDE